MTSEERNLWAYGFASLVVPAVYFAWLAGRVADAVDVADVSYVRALLWAIGVGIVVHTIGNVVALAPARTDAGVKDQRDRDIARRGDALSFYVFSVLVVGPFALAMADARAFWIANALYLAYALAAVFGVVVKAVFYRKGLEP
jgi:hypothetical protein